MTEKTVRIEELQQLEVDEKLGYILILDVRDNRDGTYTVKYQRGAHDVHRTRP